jgi:hypothetical protein
VYGLKYVQTLAASNYYLVPMIKELGGSFSQQWFFAIFAPEPYHFWQYIGRVLPLHEDPQRLLA